MVALTLLVRALMTDTVWLFPPLRRHRARHFAVTTVLLVLTVLGAAGS
jgi:hypothetical protein